MIIDFSNINGGGGGGYVLPVATSEVLGGVKVGSGLTITSAGTLSSDIDTSNFVQESEMSGYVQTSAMSGYVQTTQLATTAQTGLVKIGSGITVDSAGTISVEGGGGSGIEVVSQLPASGTDGQVVVLETQIPEHTIKFSHTEPNTYDSISATAIGITKVTYMIRLEWFGEYVNVYENTDNSLTLKDGNDTLITDIPAGSAYTYNFSQNNQYATFTVTSTGFSVVCNENIAMEYIHTEEYVPASKKDIAYIWDTTSKTCDIYQKFGEEGNPHKNNTIVTYFGELPQNEVIFEQYHPYWGSTWYWAFDGEMIRAYSDTGMTNEEYWFVKPTFNSVKAGAKNITFTDGLLVYNDYELNWTLKIHGNWADAGNGHWKPLDYEVIKTNALQLVDKTCSTRLYMPGVSDIYVEGGNGEMISMCLPNGFGTAGQMLMSQGNERPGKWVDYKPIGLADELPAFSTDGSFVIVNSGYQESATTAFLSYCTTDYNERNNFSDDTEMYWYADNYYVYFDPSGLTTTGKTFLYRIAMRTNENDNWNTSNLAYINVFREYDSVGQSFFYSWDMPNFDYYDTNGNPYAYSDSGVVNSNVTSANTAYLPIWKYWDGGYGYKFYFEYDTTTGGLKMWMRHCDPDGYPEGENYGEVPYECRNHTTEFYNGIDTEGNTSEVYTYRGGAWYKIGEFAAPV